MIKAIFFDVGGVLVRDKSVAIFKRQATLLGVTQDRLDAVARPHRRLLIKGRITRREYLHRFYAALRCRKLAWHELKTIFPKRIYYYQRVWDVAMQLKKNGYVVGVITNTVPPHRLLLTAKLSYPPFRPVIRSYQVGALKPERRIFDIARHRAGVKFSEMAFFDDHQTNVDAAKKLGIKAFVYKNPAHLIRSLRCFGVKI